MIKILYLLQIYYFFGNYYNSLGNLTTKSFVIPLFFVYLHAT